MGSVRFDGIWFLVWADDHDPPHVHASYAEVKLILELRSAVANSVEVRRGSLRPANAKRADVRHVLRMAQRHFAELSSLWEELHD